MFYVNSVSCFVYSIKVQVLSIILYDKLHVLGAVRIYEQRETRIIHNICMIHTFRLFEALYRFFLFIEACSLLERLIHPFVAKTRTFSTMKKESHENLMETSQSNKLNVMKTWLNIAPFRWSFGVWCGRSTCCNMSVQSAWVGMVSHERQTAIRLPDRAMDVHNNVAEVILGLKQFQATKRPENIDFSKRKIDICFKKCLNVLLTFSRLQILSQILLTVENFHANFCCVQLR